MFFLVTIKIKKLYMIISKVYPSCINNYVTSHKVHWYYYTLKNVKNFVTLLRYKNMQKFVLFACIFLINVI